MCSFMYRRYHYLLYGLRGFGNERKATVAVEFAFIAPVLLLIVVGMFVFGMALNNWAISPMRRRRAPSNSRAAAAIAMATLGPIPVMQSLTPRRPSLQRA